MKVNHLAITKIIYVQRLKVSILRLIGHPWVKSYTHS
jgi:hypothetical protein